MPVRYSGHEITAIALDIMPRTITRSKELRFAEWTEIRWDDAEWCIPGERRWGTYSMKAYSHLRSNQLLCRQRSVDAECWIGLLEVSATGAPVTAPPNF
jgi:hypothetical protein